MKRVLVTAIALGLLTSCSGEDRIHDQAKAIETANAFLRHIIRQEYGDAYDACLADQAKREMDVDKFAADLVRSAENLGPVSKAVFNSLVIVPGARAVEMYYDCAHQRAGNVVYHLVLEGDGTAGYRIVMIDIGNKWSYPPAAKHTGLKRVRKPGRIEVTGE